MARKKWVAQSDTSPAISSIREKRKWQIALRRYVIEKKASPQYAPYFGLDITGIREWFEIQFDQGTGWEDFGRKWQFDHIFAVTYFDFNDDADLKLCWNFTNIRVDQFKGKNGMPHRIDILAARKYFNTLYKQTAYKPCLALLQKIDNLQNAGIADPEKQQAFINRKKPFLDATENYSSFEFELLNSGRTIDEVIKEVAFLKKF